MKRGFYSQQRPGQPGQRPGQPGQRPYHQQSKQPGQYKNKKRINNSKRNTKYDSLGASKNVLQGYFKYEASKDSVPTKSRIDENELKLIFSKEIIGDPLDNKMIGKDIHNIIKDKTFYKKVDSKDRQVVIYNMLDYAFTIIKRGESKISAMQAIVLKEISRKELVGKNIENMIEGMRDVVHLEIKSMTKKMKESREKLMEYYKKHGVTNEEDCTLLTLCINAYQDDEICKEFIEHTENVMIYNYLCEIEKRINSEVSHFVQKDKKFNLNTALDVFKYFVTSISCNIYMIYNESIRFNVESERCFGMLNFKFKRYSEFSHASLEYAKSLKLLEDKDMEQEDTKLTDTKTKEDIEDIKEDQDYVSDFTSGYNETVKPGEEKGHPQ